MGIVTATKATVDQRVIRRFFAHLNPCPMMGVVTREHGVARITRTPLVRVERG